MCGLSGFNGNKNANIYKLKLLAVLNESRGKDSCGLFFNNKLYKGVKGTQFDMSSATAFMGASKLTSVKHIINKTVLFHTRQGTKGAASEQNAHPFAYFRNQEEQAAYDLGDHSLVPDFVGMMNGTLDDLYIANSPHAKRGYDWKHDMNDSRMLFSILFHQDFDYLKEYVGAAALAFCYPKEPNTLCLWHGATVQDGFLIEERPLHYYYDKKDEGIYFSSLKEHLKVIAEGAEIISVPLNQIIKFHNGEIVETIPIDRKIEKVVYTHHNYYGANNYNGYTRPLPVKKPEDKKATDLFGRKIEKKDELSYCPIKGIYIINGKPAQKYYNVEDALFGNVAVYFQNGVIMKSKRKKQVSEEHISIIDGCLVDYSGKPVTPLYKNSSAVLFVPFDNQSFTVGENGRILNSFPMNTTTNGFYNSYRVLESTYSEFLKRLQGLITIPSRIFTPFGMKMYLRDTYGYHLDLDGMYPGSIFNIINAIKAKIDGVETKQEAITLDDILDSPCSNSSIRELIELVGKTEDADTKPQTWFSKTFGSIPDFTATIEENLNSCKLQGFLYDYLGQEADLVEYLKDSDTHAWACSLKDFFAHTNFDKLSAFNKKFNTSFWTLEAADDMFFGSYGIRYDWKLTPSQNYVLGEEVKWKEAFEMYEV